MFCVQDICCVIREGTVSWPSPPRKTKPFASPRVSASIPHELLETIELQPHVKTVTDSPAVLWHPKSMGEGEPSRWHNMSAPTGLHPTGLHCSQQLVLTTCSSTLTFYLYFTPDISVLLSQSFPRQGPPFLKPCLPPLTLFFLDTNPITPMNPKHLFFFSDCHHVNQEVQISII